MRAYLNWAAHEFQPQAALCPSGKKIFHIVFCILSILLRGLIALLTYMGKQILTVFWTPGQIFAKILGLSGGDRGSF